jgi:hypothetical protein
VKCSIFYNIPASFPSKKEFLVEFAPWRYGVKWAILTATAGAGIVFGAPIFEPRKGPVGCGQRRSPLNTKLTYIGYIKAVGMSRDMLSLWAERQKGALALQLPKRTVGRAVSATKSLREIADPKDQ